MDAHDDAALVTRRMPASRRGGCYLLANDAIADWAIALLESIRTHDPDLRVVLIPFDDACTRMRVIAARYGVEVFDDPSLAALDEVGARFAGDHHVGVHQFRKLAAFWGPLDEFVYLDADVVTLLSLSPMLDAFADSAADLAVADLDPDQVYRPGPLRDVLSERRQRLGFSTGFFMGRHGTLTLDDVQQAACRALPVIDQLVVEHADQAFMNFLVDDRGLRVAQLADLVVDLARTTWAVHDLRTDAEGRRRLDAPGREDHGRRVPFLHWAGLPIGLQMPNVALFTRFRLRSEVWWRRVWFVLRELAWAGAVLRLRRAVPG